MKSPVIFRIFRNDQIQFVKQFVNQEQIVIGQLTPEGNQVDIQLDSTEVSPIHCLIEKRGQDYYLCDLGSTQGTLKNGQLVVDDILKVGDEFQVGPFKIAFLTLPALAQKAAPAVAAASAPVVPAAAAPTPVTSAPTPVVTAPPPPPVVEPTPVVVEQPVVQKVEPVVPVAAPTPVTPPPTPQSEKLIEAVLAEAVVKETVINTAKPIVHSDKPSIQSKIAMQRPVLKPQFSFKAKTERHQKTFAPAGAFNKLSEFIRPGKGEVIQVITSWKGRVLDTKSLPALGIHKAGVGQIIQLPLGTVPEKTVLVDCSSGVQVMIPSGATAEVKKDNETKQVSDTRVRLSQNEVVYVHFINGIEVAVRFSPTAMAVPLESPIMLSSSELTGILLSLIIATLTSLVVTVFSPKENKKTDDDVQRVAQVIFNKPPPPLPKPVVPPPPPEKPPEETKPVEKKPEVKKEVKLADKQQEQKNKGDVTKPDAKAQQAQKAGRAAEVKPKDPKLKQKMFTSTKQGGSIKTGETAGANAQSKEKDPTNSGLLAAFGGGGARSKLDKAYNGSGELLGNAEKATGSSGFNENRAGDDLGSKFKDTGAGGKGTATQGIAGVGTKGRGTGMSAYGSGNGFGSKDSVGIVAGGSEEDFVGSIDREAVRRAVRSATAAFKACYEREYKKDSNLEGKVVIAWEIHERGVAQNARVVRDKTTIGNSAVENCVRERMLSIRFPEPPAGTVAEVTFPFVFNGQR